MKRAIIAVVVGYGVWTLLWLGGNAVLFAEAAEAVGAGVRYDAPGPLAGVLALSLVGSIVGGGLAGWIARGRSRGVGLVLGALLLLTGIGVQMGVWSLMPTWYHLVFLGLLLPVTFLAARLGGGGRSGERVPQAAV
ncbi:MAG: hypothetical protein H6811_01465 [Phycisphaeraceae bacterium]|nr:hypothetical protein [Phycisphaeraceae bacterium]